MEIKVKRSEELLNRIANRTGMTKEGKNWLIRAVDPFHDLPVEIEGFPDGQMGQSVVQTIPLSIEISRPSTVPSTDNWDCLIHIDDSPSAHTNSSCFINRNTVYGAGDVSFQGYAPSGGLTCVTGPSGANLTFVPSVGSTVEYSSLQAPSASLMDPARVIAQAFEVRNTTAELFKQGDVIVFEQPLNSRDYPVSLTQVDTYPPTIFTTAFSVKARTLPPRSQQEATILPSSRRFEAREGCYVVGALESLDNEPAIGAPTSTLLYDHSNSPDGPWPDSGTTVYVRGDATSFANVRLIQPTLMTPFGRRGAYFSGLSPETTLKVNYKVTIERFPSSTSPVINFARPTPTRDTVALEVYTEILNRMPVGVPVSENGLGDWFTGAVAEIIDAVTGTTFATKADKWQKEISKPKVDRNSEREQELNRKLKLIEEWEKTHRQSLPKVIGDWEKLNRQTPPKQQNVKNSKPNISQNDTSTNMKQPNNRTTVALAKQTKSSRNPRK